LCLAQPLFGGAPAPDDPAIRELCRNLLDAQIAQLDRGLATAIRESLNSQELTLVTRQVVGGLAEDDQFQRYVERKAGASAKTGEVQIGRYVEEYMLSSTNVSPDVAAWFRLTSDLRAPWADVYGSYQKLQVNHAKEFLPKLILINRPLHTEAEATNWLDVLEDAYRDASSPRERMLCLGVVAKRALNLASIDGGKKCLTELSAWLEAADKTQMDEAPLAQERRFARFFVAFARRDFVHAADFAKGPRLRTVRPLVLAMAGDLNAAGGGRLESRCHALAAGGSGPGPGQGGHSPAGGWCATVTGREIRRLRRLAQIFFICVNLRNLRTTCTSLLIHPRLRFDPLALLC
jgi:hypothetical protein